ncbi:hypothetical protein ACIBI9_30335 [Nonomuraea sp. NPDC050451]|uniref:hypothetical protein n=1 Tax=Nonomuraea sp. NPDC050451 TaxID=3364364 RepID=UPI00378BF5AC
MYAGDVHAELANVALPAATNADVDRLNAAARAVRRAAGEISGPEVRYRQAGGRTLALAVGDHVRVPTNDYRARHGQGANVLNGYRGRLVRIDDQRRVLVEWRAPYADGPRVEQEWITPGYIAAGGLGHGTALTVASAQGRHRGSGARLRPRPRPAQPLRRHVPGPGDGPPVSAASCWRATPTGPGTASPTTTPSSCSARWPPTPPPCVAIAPTAW